MTIALRPVDAATMSWSTSRHGKRGTHVESTDRRGRGRLHVWRRGDASVIYAEAQPPGNDNWIVLDGTCDGQPATLLDPRGGNTAFLVGGSVGVGKIFTFIDAATGEVLDQIVNGRGIDPERLVTCEFLFEDTEIPGVGVIDLLFRVQALVTPQGS